MCCVLIGAIVEQAGDGMSIRWMTSEILQPILHGVTLRMGGFSRGPHSTLNLGFSVGDEPSTVARNHQLIQSTIHWSQEHIAYMEQIHSTRVQMIQSTGNHPRCDGLVTDQKGLMLWGYFADCTPLIFADAARNVIGLAHAGWRGTVGGIAREMVSTMISDEKCKSADIHVFIGPCIDQCCYEVNDTVIKPLRNRYTWWKDVCIETGEGRYMFSLKECNRRLLLECGIKEQHIEISSACTCCQSEKFFSHRRDGSLTGRMAAFVALS